MIGQSFDETFVANLRKFRRGDIDLPSFQDWIARQSTNLSLMVPTGVLLKLRRGDKEKAMRAVARLLPACAYCGQMPAVGVFTSREQHSTYASWVTQAVRNGTFKPIPRPDWLHSTQQHFGADGYFQCTNCGSLWTLVEPEREDNGLWERLA